MLPRRHDTMRRMFCQRLVVAAGVAVLAGGTSVSAQAPPTAVPNAAVLVYRDQAMSDASLARIAEIVASAVPPNRWTRLEVLAPGEPLETLVDRALDYYAGSDAFARPQTAATLVRLLRQGNTIPAVRTSPIEVRLPPMPVRAHGQFAERDMLRGFNAAAGTYSIDQPATALALGTADAAADYKLVLSESAGELTANGQPTPAGRAQITRMVERMQTERGDANFIVRPHMADDPAAMLSSERSASAVRDVLNAELGAVDRVQIVAAGEVSPTKEPTAKQHRIIVEGRSMNRPDVSFFAPAASDLEVERDASSTAIVVPFEGLARKAFATLPPGVAVVSGRLEPDGSVARVGYSRIEFLGRGTPCAIDSTWLSDSPHFASARQRIAAALTEPSASALIARAQRARLVILDFDFTGAGHGNKVRSVMLQQLRALGAERLSPEVTAVDLLLRNETDKQAALMLLDAYSRSREFVVSNRPYLPEARRWIREDSQHVVWTGDEIHDLYLQALLWKHLRNGAFVNMSFRLLSPALRMLQPAFLQKPDGAFLVVAAGNDATALDPKWVPQDASNGFANTINVTHGLPDGRIIGTVSGGEQSNTIVSLAAPGCGFTTDLVSPVESGSSLAAPYVAVAAWVKSLLDGGANGAAMRRALLDAAIPIPIQQPGVESGGMFDAARLIAMSRPYLRSRTGLRPLVNPTLSVHCQGDPPEDRRTFGPRSNVRQSAVVFARGATFMLWRRSISQEKFPRADVDATCIVDALTFRVDGGPVLFGSAAAFAEEVAEYAF